MGNLESLRTYVDVRDAVEAYNTLVMHNPIKGEVYNIGGTYTAKVADTLNYLISLSSVKNIQIIVEKGRLRPIDADLQVPNMDKYYRHTGWRPKISFQKTMKDLLNYWRLITSNESYLRR